MGGDSRVRTGPRATVGWVRDHYDDPVLWAEATQVLKTGVAVVLAWTLAAEVWGLPQPFLAPWSALLVVQSTVYRTFSEGAASVGSTVLGVLLAWVVGGALGLSPLAVGVVALVGLATRALPRVTDINAAAAAATAVVVICTGGSDDDSVLLARLLDTAIGIGVGLVVNLAVWPPLRARSAIAGLDVLDDHIGELLSEIAEELGPELQLEKVDEWVDRTRSLDGEIDHAYSLVRQAVESARMNPRRSASTLRQPKQWYRLLRRMEQANAETRSMVRTIGRSSEEVQDWGDDFRTRFVDLLGRAGAAITQSDPDPVRRVHDDLEEFVAGLSSDGVAPELWPEYGALVVNLRNIVVAMDEVAAANPLTPQRRGPIRPHDVADGGTA